jgi:proteasome lid subunit RPN8/RPN11
MELVETARESIVGHARDAAPAEACGLLGGRPDENPVVTAAIATPNVATEPRTRYEIDPEALLAGQEAFEDAGLDLVGFYHSHPEGPDGPSETDRELAQWGGTHMLIVSLSGPEPAVGAWHYDDGAFRSTTLDVIPAPASGDST